ncbi:hypothetical protein A2165_03240 [Candidatus Curtissbacteria bacterium RBG_13_40_7]|uniref:Uncharacterized protein n=1 Tax=Candidatus Curtissbacteria bacterium RBG_13_40_7 TaxID=1797706 RepID=A0A1F5FWQ1_9BACT|nr:MAG: hypothetical protein A2165_03240 [Candidatus Curtissbacteria bacterium RBG_13_40_7]
MKIVRTIWRKWLIIARIIGNFQGQVILTIFYLILLLPVGLALRIFADPLRLHKKLRTNFESWQHPKEDLEQARKQY